MKLKIRKIKKADLPQLARIYKDAFSTGNTHEKWDEAQALRCMEFLYKRNKHLALTAVLTPPPRSSEILAGGIFGDMWPYYDADYLYNVELFVDPKWQDHQIGSRLALKLYQIAKLKYGAQKCSFLTLSKNKRLIHWYQKQGFEICHELPVIECDIDSPIGYLKNVLK